MDNVTTKSVTKAAERIVTRDDGDTKLIKVPISSTRPDRDGDEFAEEALVGMQKQIRREQPLIFQNHGFTGFNDPLYDQSETIGTLTDAEIHESKDPDGNTEDKDLVGFINPDSTHPEGERMMDQVEDGQAIKFSVGFRVLEADAKDPESENDERRVFKDVDLMETSKVGIPANPDATATVAAKAASLTDELSAAGVDISDEAAFAKALAAELVSKDGRVDADTVRDATPTQFDGEPTDTERKDVNVEGGCDEDADCPDGEVCMDGECVDESQVDDTDSYLMTDDGQERLDALEERLASLEDTIAEALGDGGEPDETDDDGVAEQPDDTFEVDGEEYSADDIRELQDAAADADVEDSQTDVEPDPDDVVDPDETDDADTDSEADDGRTKSVEEVLHG